MLSGNVLDGYSKVREQDQVDWAVKLAWIGMAFSVMTSYPLVSNATRGAFFRLFSNKPISDQPAILYIAATAGLILLTGFAEKKKRKHVVIG